MAVFSRLKTWVSNEVLTASDLNGEFDNIISNMQPSGIEDASVDVSAMQSNTDPGGVGSESLATTLLGEIQRLRYKLKQVIGQAQWYSTPVGSLSTGGIDSASLAANSVTTAKIADLNVTTGKLANDAVTTAKILDANVTRAKLEAVGQQISSSSGSFSTSAGSLVDVTNLSVTITTIGRPVKVMIISDGSVTGSNISGSNSSDLNVVFGLKILRDATRIAEFGYAAAGVSDFGIFTYKTPPSFSILDVPSAGTYTYKVQAQASSPNTAFVTNCKLVAYEL